MKIKVCGITNPKDAKFAVSLGADYLGFIDYELSPRYIQASDAEEIIAKLPVSVISVGVFVNKPLNELKKIQYIFDVLQLHGDEDMAYINELDVEVWKAFRVKDEESIKEIKAFDVDGYLLDTFVASQYGGTGKSFDWGLVGSLVEAGVDKKKIIVSGGIGPENILEAVKTSVFAVDINSKVERMPGKKDKKKLKKLFELFRDSLKKENHEGLIT
ncbi:MAG: phosphoribosylanthranilate isomerase [bacterium]|nr:phosphoribosylanthranilate isomerase [bacterium]